MRILLVTKYRNMVGGVEAYLGDVLPALRARGHEVALFHETPATAGQATIDGTTLDLQVWCAGDGSEALRQATAWGPEVAYAQGLDSPELEEALLGRFPAVLFAHNYHGTCVSGTKRHATPCVRPCARTLGPPCLLLYYPRRCGGLSPRTLLHDYRLQRRRQAQLSRYRAVLVASRHMQEEYRRHGVPEHRIQLVPLFPPGQSPDPLPPGDCPPRQCVLMVGRLTDLKGGRFLVEALRQASQDLGRSLTLVVAGDGPERPSLESLAHRLGVRAEFVGWVTTARRTQLMRQADVLAVPSVWPEPFGLVGIEAACVGLPAVAFAVGGIPEWLVPGESGEIAAGDPPRVSALAEALTRALADPAHLSRLRHGAWQAAHRYTRENHIAALETILEQAARG
jgi:glycosyltransferase involved in cell wall biosynthesis